MLMHDTNTTKYTCKLSASLHKINVTKERSCYKYNKPLRTVCLKTPIFQSKQTMTN